MNKAWLSILALLTGAVGNGCSTVTPTSRELPLLDACRPMQRVPITSVSPSKVDPQITIGATNVCVTPGPALVVWHFKQGIDGYVFTDDAVTLKDGSSSGLIFAKGNKARFFAVFDNEDPATWTYGLKFKSTDGLHTWSCDPTIFNNDSGILRMLDGIVHCKVTPPY